MSDEYPVLFIGDDADAFDAYTLLLEQEGYYVFACSNPFGARDWLQTDRPGVVLSDVCTSGCNGIDLITSFHQDGNQLPILLITEYGDVPTAVDATKKGAWDFLQKLVNPGKSLVLVEDALHQREPVTTCRYCRRQRLQTELVGYSDWVNQYRQCLWQLAEMDVAVWSYGRPGTGRMTGVRYLHQPRCSAEGLFIHGELTLENAG